jgi:aryl-alcohol dehydrogenase-like predicted oxidoreductase
LNEEESRPLLRQSPDLGINFFDTANVYSVGASEEVLGRFLRAHTRREAVVIATKVHAQMRDEPHGQGLSRNEIFYELDQSLRRLGTDYVDLHQIHRWDYETPIEETLEALHDVVRAGKVFFRILWLTRASKLRRVIAGREEKTAHRSGDRCPVGSAIGGLHVRNDAGPAKHAMLWLDALRSVEPDP